MERRKPALENVQTFVIGGGGSCLLCLYRWECEGALGRLLVLPGMGDHAGRYGELAGRLNALGWSVYGLDLRGQGRSGGERSRIERFVEYEWDVDAALEQEWAGSELPLVLLGYSVGATVAVQYALAHPQRVSGLVLVSPCLSIESRVQGWNDLLLTLGNCLVPHFVFSRQYRPQAVTGDPEQQRRLAADRLVNGTLRPRLIHELRRVARDCLARAERLAVPVLILCSPTDRIVDPSGVEEFHARLGGRGNLRCYPGLRHDLLHERGREAIYADLCLWLSAHWGCTPRPSQF
jgi:alpha-beta hydrolase superfamily lysophospholipase